MESISAAETTPCPPRPWMRICTILVASNSSADHKSLKKRRVARSQRVAECYAPGIGRCFPPPFDSSAFQACWPRASNRRCPNVSSRRCSPRQLLTPGVLKILSRWYL